MLIPVIIVVSFVVFALMDLAPGDITAMMDLDGMTPEQVQAIRDEHLLDHPLIYRYGRYMFRLIQGDLGVGDFSGISVWYNFITRLPATLALAGATILIGVVFGIPMGIFAAKRAGSVADAGVTAFAMVGMSMPGFWQGILMMLLFSYVLGWLPAGGFNDGILSLILPATVAASTLLAAAARQTRSSMLEVLKADYLRTARAKGVPENTVINKHALSNALIPIVTTVGVSIAISVAGTAVIEWVFAWPGVGRFIVTSVAARDVTSTTGAVVLTAVMYVIILLLVDLAYAFIDPRIRAQYASKSKKRKKSAAVGAKTTATAISVMGVSTQTVVSAEVSAPAPVVVKAPEKITGKTPVKAPDPNFVSFATRTEADMKEQTLAAIASKDGVSVTRKHRKRSRGGEIFRHLVRNPGAMVGMIIIAILVLMFIASQFIPWSAVTAPNVQYRFSSPSWQFPFGTDFMGRDLFMRTIYAVRFSLPIGVGATSVATLFGVFLGAIAAYYEGSAADEIIMRLSDSLASIPGLLLGMVIITTLGQSVPNLIIAIGVSAIPFFVRMARASVLTIKGNEFVEAARAVGLGHFRILFAQVLPNGLAPIIVSFTASLGMAILISAGLSFLGFGVPIPNPEWGSLVSDGRAVIRHAPWLTTFPGLFIMFTVMGFNLLGDGLRDAFDPKLKK